jgi:hypothetical protein
LLAIGRLIDSNARYVPGSTGERVRLKTRLESVDRSTAV